MIIPIRWRSGSEDIPIEQLEWVMLELNGELLQPLDKSQMGHRGAIGSCGSGGGGAVAAAAAAASRKKRVELGSVRVDTDGTATMIIGNHELKGKSTKLKEPFAVLRKRKLKKLEAAEEEKTITKRDNFASLGGVEYEVAGIVRKKLKFDQYPKSIMR